MKTAVRKSVTLFSQDLELITSLQMQGSAERQALQEVTGISLDDNASEAASIHALITAGRTAIEEKVVAQGYAAYAASLDDEVKAAHQAMRRRHPLNRS